MVLALGSSEAASETKAQAGCSLDCLCSQRQRDTGMKENPATIAIFSTLVILFSCEVKKKGAGAYFS